MISKIRILIVGDHFTARVGLRVPFSAEPDLEVIAEAHMLMGYATGRRRRNS